MIHPELSSSMNRVRRADDLERARQHRLIATARAVRRERASASFWRRSTRLVPAELDRAV